MKNINSFQFVVKAIEYEYKRQVEAIEAGEKIVQETRKFDADTGKTYTMRTKEDADDYRYFPDPDLPPIELTDEEIKSIKDSIPELPDARKQKYMEKYGLTAYNSENLIADMDMSNYFEQAAKLTEYPKIAANFIIGEVMRLNTSESFECPISAENTAKVATLSGEQTINASTAKKLIARMWKDNCDPAEIVEKENLKQINDRAELTKIAQEVIAKGKKLVDDYKNGKEQAFKALMGQAMGKTAGKANPVILEEILKDLVGNPRQAK